MNFDFSIGILDIVEYSKIETKYGLNFPRIELNPTHPIPDIKLMVICIAQHELASNGNIILSKTLKLDLGKLQ